MTARQGVDVRRYSAFTRDPAGGNPAGVVLDATGLDDARMQAIAADVGYSETAFVSGRDAGGHHVVRYFTPRTEVPFCGHATIATAVALADGERPLELTFATGAGAVAVRVESGEGGVRAALRSVPPKTESPVAADVRAALAALGWSAGDLDSALDPVVADAGARHLLLFARERDRLRRLPVDFGPLKEVSDRLRTITVALLWREDGGTVHGRNLGPSIGVPEDPATGAAAAALGGHLAAVGALDPPACFTVRQGEDMGRPSRLEVRVTGAGEPVEVAGHAVPIGSRNAGTAGQGRLP